jgi:hypothetical protein
MLKKVTIFQVIAVIIFLTAFKSSFATECAYRDCNSDTVKSCSKEKKCHVKDIYEFGLFFFWADLTLEDGSCFRLHDSDYIQGDTGRAEGKKLFVYCDPDKKKWHLGRSYE